MATILDKDLTRESTVKIEEREIQITLTENQNISMKLKGMKSGQVEIGIGELYKQLKGDVVEDVPLKSVTTQTGGRSKPSDDPMISLYDLRSRLNVSGFDYATTVKFDSIIVDLIKDAKKR